MDQGLNELFYTEIQSKSQMSPSVSCWEGFCQGLN